MSSIPTLLVFALGLLVGCTTAAGTDRTSTHTHELQEHLLQLSASDFATHGPRPSAFRGVELRYREGDNGSRSYMLCGEARVNAESTAEWVYFATIKTDGYEQWLGSAATDMCARAVASVPGDEDLASALKRELDAIANSHGEQ